MGTAAWSWDPTLPGYVAPDGRTVLLADLRPIADRRAEESRARLRALADALSAGRLSADRFEAAARTEIRLLHLELRLLAVGGRQHARPDDYGRTGAVLRAAYAHLRAFVARIQRSELSDARIRARIAQYAGANAIEAFENGRLHSMRAAGFTHKRRVLRPATHCFTCRHEAEQGWVPIDQPGWVIGDSECGPECRCTIEYRRFADHAEAGS